MKNKSLKLAQTETMNKNEHTSSFKEFQRMQMERSQRQSSIKIESSFCNIGGNSQQDHPEDPEQCGPQVLSDDRKNSKSAESKENKDGESSDSSEEYWWDKKMKEDENANGTPMKSRKSPMMSRKSPMTDKSSRKSPMQSRKSPLTEQDPDKCSGTFPAIDAHSSAQKKFETPSAGNRNKKSVSHKPTSPASSTYSQILQLPDGSSDEPFPSLE